MLRLPLKQAVALVFHMTAYVTWRSFVEESGLTPVAAKTLARDTVDAVLFGEGGLSPRSRGMKRLSATPRQNADAGEHRAGGRPGSRSRAGDT